MYNSEWEVLGGYYWVIQEQILHQWILKEFTDQLNRLYPNRKVFYQFMKQQINDMSQKIYTKKIQHVILSEKVVQLFDSMNKLLESIADSSKPKVTTLNLHITFYHSTDFNRNPNLYCCLIIMLTGIFE